MRVNALVLIIVSGLLHAGSAAADSPRLRGADNSSVYVRVFGRASAPFGFVQFCAASPEECVPAARRTQRFQATPERLSELDEINRIVNKAIQPATDAEIYGVTERWVIPVSRGDCEDYALMKRQILIR